MIRPATLADLARLNVLVHDMHKASIYSEEPLLESAIRSLLMDGVRRHGGEHAGSTLFNVIEFRGQVEGLMLGLLQRLYLIGTNLEAMDLWLYATPRCPKLGVSQLIDAYSAWASSIPKVREVKLSWTDAMKVDGARLEKLYKHKGFEPCGRIYRRSR